jgi:hypothetical protein
MYPAILTFYSNILSINAQLDGKSHTTSAPQQFDNVRTQETIKDEECMIVTAYDNAIVVMDLLTNTKREIDTESWLFADAPVQKMVGWCFCLNAAC